MTETVAEAIAAHEAGMVAHRQAEQARWAKEQDAAEVSYADRQEAGRLLNVTAREVVDVRLVEGLGVCIKVHDGNWYCALEPQLIAEAGGYGIVGLTLRKDFPIIKAYTSQVARQFLASMGIAPPVVD